MKVYKNSKIYILSSGDEYTGGTLSLQQLCKALLQLNLDAKLVYVDNENKPTSPELIKLQMPYTTDIDDDRRNIMIFPETIFMSTLPVQNVQKVIWWLSTDFHFHQLYHRIGEYITKRRFLQMPSPEINLYRFNEFEHIAHCEYVYQFLKVNQVPDKKIFMLGDYVSEHFYNGESKVNLDAKENIAAYNPRKDHELSPKIIAAAPDLTFIPIQNMSPDEVQNLLARAKVYIDFGFHPGREHIPREAALSHAVVITGMRGSAGNDIDVPLPPDFKFDDSIGNDENIIPRIIEKIKYIFENFQTEHDRQNPYREEVLKDPEVFFNNVSKIFRGNRA